MWLLATSHVFSPCFFSSSTFACLFIRLPLCLLACLISTGKKIINFTALTDSTTRSLSDRFIPLTRVVTCGVFPNPSGAVSCCEIWVIYGFSASCYNVVKHALANAFVIWLLIGSRFIAGSPTGGIINHLHPQFMRRHCCLAQTRNRHSLRNVSDTASAVLFRSLLSIFLVLFCFLRSDGSWRAGNCTLRPGCNCFQGKDG